MLMCWTGFRRPGLPAVHVWISMRLLIQAAMVSDRPNDLFQRTLRAADGVNATTDISPNFVKSFTPSVAVVPETVTPDP